MLKEQLEREVEAGNVRRALSEDGRLAIYAYTPKCEFADEWNHVQRQARGLVLNASGKVIIRCVPKFFNHDHPKAEKFDLAKAEDNDDGFYISEKTDGYMCQLRLDTNYGLIVTSKGSSYF